MGVITGAKNTSGFTFITPSAAPVVELNDLIMPFTATIYWVGPMAPMLSGGNGPLEEELVNPLNVVPIVWGRSVDWI